MVIQLSFKDKAKISWLITSRKTPKVHSFT